MKPVDVKSEDAPSDSEDEPQATEHELTQLVTTGRRRRRKSSTGTIDSDDNIKSEEKGGIGLANNGGKGTKRRPHSKSRRGCATCKRRRVKCDETHPMCKKCEHLGLECSFTIQAQEQQQKELQQQTVRQLNLVDIRLFYFYTTDTWKTITGSGIHDDKVWGSDVPILAFEYPYLMHAILTFAASHLSRTEKVPNDVITMHRGEALKLLRQEVQQVTPQNLDALVAASILLILDSLANASDGTSPGSLPASTWVHHVRGAATILMSVSPLPPESRFFELVNIDLSDLADTQPVPEGMVGNAGLECFDDDLKSLYPVSISSPYLQTLAYLDKLHHQRMRSDYILRIFSFPVFLDANFVNLLLRKDEMAIKVAKAYLKLLMEFCYDNRNWFIQGIAQNLEKSIESELGGLAFVTSALPVPMNPFHSQFGDALFEDFAGSEQLSSDSPLNQFDVNEYT